MADLKQLANDWPHLSQRLDHALELDASERAAWLEALDEPETVKARLRELLQDAPGIETDDFLGQLPHLTVNPNDGDGSAVGGVRAAAGLLIGPYRLVEPLGSGGMGEVWLAERDDGVPRRRVALKLPHLGWSSGLAERLARERDILASLEHPNIARLYDAGVDQFGRPYLALEYVDGVPIDRYCATHALTLAERLGLVLQVAAAVAHAHTKLVVHRDLKPSNILVTAQGDVRLLDFGIAKLLQDGVGDATELTRLEGRALTPDYASPEQIRAEPIGTASDVYSLGVVAYELVTGVRPYALKSIAAASLAEAIAQVDAPLASRAATDATTKRQLAGDLDAIFNKALKKDPAERYATVGEFADDIGRHLRHEPVQARPDRLGYRTRKFLRRHTLQVAAGSLVVLAVLAGTGVALWQARAARIEAARAEQVKNFALSIVTGADTESGANRETTAVELLQAARARVDKELAGSPATAVELMIAVGSGLQSQGRVAEASTLLRETRERALRTLGDTHSLTLSATNAYGLALVGEDRPKDAIAILGPAVAAAERERDAHAQIEALFNLSTAQLAAAEGEAGLASARAAVAVLASQGSAARPLDAFNAWGQLANALNATQQPGLADAARRAVDLAQQLYGTQLTGNALNARLLLSRGLSAEGRDAEALAELESVYAEAVRNFGPDQPRIEPIALFLGVARADAGDLDGAVAAFRAALAVAEQVKGGTGGNRGIDHFSLGRALAAKHADSEALEHLDESVRLLTAAVGAAPQTQRARSVQAGELTRLGRLDEADRIFAELERAALPPAEKAQSDGRRARLRSAQGRHAEAIALARQSVEGVKTNPSKLVRATAVATLGYALLAGGAASDAVAPLADAARLYAEKQSTMTPDHQDVLTALARAQSVAAGTAASPPHLQASPR